MGGRAGGWDPWGGGGRVCGFRKKVGGWLGPKKSAHPPRGSVCESMVRVPGNGQSVRRKFPWEVRLVPHHCHANQVWHLVSRLEINNELINFFPVFFWIAMFGHVLWCPCSGLGRRLPSWPASLSRCPTVCWRTRRHCPRGFLRSMPPPSDLSARTSCAGGCGNL